MSNRTRQNNKRANRKMESNENPEIPDRGETSEKPGLPSGSSAVGSVKVNMFYKTILTGGSRLDKNRHEI